MIWIFQREMVLFRAGFFLLLITCLFRSDCFGVEPNSESPDGVVEKWITNSELIPWASTTAWMTESAGRFGIGLIALTVPQNVHKKKTWKNYYGYYMKCFEHSLQKKLRVSIYDRNYYGARYALLTFEVKTCEENLLLNSFTMCKKSFGKHYCKVRFINKSCMEFVANPNGRCSMGTYRFKCLTVTQKFWDCSNPQKSISGNISAKGDGYINTWNTATEEESSGISEESSETSGVKQTNPMVLIPCKESIPGEVIKVLPREELPWGIEKIPWLFSYSIVYEQPTNVVLKGVWINSNKGGYFMKCFEHKGLNQFRVNVYDQPGVKVRVLGTIEVTSCTSTILNSITILRRTSKTHRVMLINQSKCCKLYIFNFELRTDIVRCPSIHKRSSQKSDNGYVNSWKKIEQEELNGIIKENAEKKKQNNGSCCFSKPSDDSSASNG